MTLPDLRSARWSAALLPRDDIAPATSCSGWPRPASIRTAIHWCAGSCSEPGCVGSAGAVRAARDARRRAADADAHLREIVPRAIRATGRSRRSRTSPAAGFPTTSRACCPKGLARTSISRACRCRRCSSGLPRRRRRRAARCCAPSIAASAWSRWSTPARPTRSAARSAATARPSCGIGEVVAMARRAARRLSRASRPRLVSAWPRSASPS